MNLDCWPEYPQPLIRVCQIQTCHASWKDDPE